MMTTYPSSLDNKKILTFRSDNEIKYFVAKKSNFENKEDFKVCLVENKLPIGEEIEEKYMRFYSVFPKKKECSCCISNNEYYAFADRGRGAIKVFAIKRGILNND